MNVTIIGLGLIGGSVARACAEQKLMVSSWDPNPDTRAAARAWGIPVAESREAAVEHADLVVVATPLVAMEQTFQWLAQCAPPQAVITDVGSVKEPVIAHAVASGVGDRFVAGHPMAGAESSGFDAASSSLFRGATWAVTPLPLTQVDRVLVVARFVMRVLGARVMFLTPDIHDAGVALVSHVPHVLAHELRGVVGQDRHSRVAQALAAGSFRDMTRVARGDAVRNAAMVWENRDQVSRVLDVMIADFTDLRRVLGSASDQGDVEAFFTRGGTVSESDRAHATLTVTQDTPVSVLTALGELGHLVVALTDVDDQPGHGAHLTFAAHHGVS